MSKAKKQLQKLPEQMRARIVRKIYWFAQHENPLEFAEPLHHSPAGNYRLRVGDYRIFFDLEKRAVTIMTILSIKKRDHAYD